MAHGDDIPLPHRLDSSRVCVLALELQANPAVWAILMDVLDDLAPNALVKNGVTLGGMRR
jgi:hypothetical protein